MIVTNPVQPWVAGARISTVRKPGGSPAKRWCNTWQRCQALLQWGSIAPVTDNDFLVSDTSGGVTLKNIHRRKGDTDIYFVANTARLSGAATCRFEVMGRQPELWDPVTATLRNLPQFTSDGKATFIPLSFDKAQSFLLFLERKIQSNNLPVPAIFRHKKKWRI